MARRRSAKKGGNSLRYVQWGVMAVLAVFLCALAVDRTVHFLTTADMFRIQGIVLDPSVNFISPSDLDRLRGKSIFDVNLRSWQRWLQTKYPQAERLRVRRQFPDVIEVTAKKREPFAVIPMGGRDVVIDREGVVLGFNAQAASDLPLIQGVTVEGPAVVGQPLRHRNWGIFLDIIDAFQKDKTLHAYRIATVTMDSRSKIYATLRNGVQVILDQDKVPGQIEKLGILLTQGHLDMKKVGYIDLRFKEPILGRK